MQTETRQKFLYTVPYWGSFPASEYGGLIVVIANNDEECLDLLTPEGDASDFYPEPTMEWIKEKSKKFELSGGTLPSEIVSQFLT